MPIKSALSRPFAAYISSKIKKRSRNAVAWQQKIFSGLIKKAAATAFGREHHFIKINSHDDFVKSVPVRDYEGIKPYIERIKNGETGVLWNGKPVYFAKTSGTTSGIKYIPVTKASIPNHISSARDALLMYIAESGNTQFVDGKMMFLSGSPELEKTGGILTGRLSGIVNHHVPAYLTSNRVPSYKTNCIEDWEKKLDAIVEETLHEKLTVLSGIPPWVQMYLDRITAKTGKKAGEVFPSLSLFVYGGVNYEPYRAKIEHSIGRRVDSIELFPASEGFFAFQDSMNENGLLLNTWSGIFYEFIKADDYFSENPERITLSDVKEGVNYALIISSNAGLWAYSIGDTVRFVSVNPYRLVVSGRTGHYISAFGEHVIAEEVEKALMKASSETGSRIIEFTVAPQVNPQEGLPYHEWLIEFEEFPADMESFASRLDECMQQQNIYYKDLADGNVLQRLRIIPLRKNAFIDFMKSKGKLGGQNKVPRLSNDRAIAGELVKFALSK